MATSEKLFAYGTLRLEPVQVATFGRKLAGEADSMTGYTLRDLKIENPKVVATSGKTHHPAVFFTGKPDDRVQGVVFAITRNELQQVDDYEVGVYRRERVLLDSGKTAWVYVDRESPRRA